MVAIDHVIILVPDLDAAAERLLDEHGLASVEGGRHEALGTANRLVPLGTSYLELLAVVDQERFAASGARFAADEGLVGWMARCDDFDERAARLDVSVIPLSRQQPDGATISWRLAGIELAGSEPSLPVLIDWGLDDAHHPARQTVEHRVAVDGISWLQLRGDSDRVHRWCQPEALPLRITGGTPAVEAVGLILNGEETILRWEPQPPVSIARS